MQMTKNNRDQLLQKMSETHYDVFIIGGGITGAGIALDAITRGMKVALCEMQDFAAGTSSRSTKLVHGGLRYLKQLEVKVVAEVGKEREIVYENGPHVTTPEWMLLPIYEGGTFGPVSTSLGLRVYDFLASVKKQERRTMLTSTEVLQKEPLLKQEGLRGGGYYVEYRTDDARLTIEVMKKAAEYGAHVSNYTKVVDFIYWDSKMIGVKVEDLVTGNIYEIRAKKIVNATGPWADTVRNQDHFKDRKTLQLTKGVHIVLDQSRFPLKQAIYFDTEDGRMIFAIPREGKVYVGTTDSFYNNDPIHPNVTKEDRAYLIQAIAFMFPEAEITDGDIESSWAGVRPLISEEGKDPSEISRKDEIWVSASGLITIAGGKLTGYRKMAETVVDLIAKQCKQEGYKLFDVCHTKHLAISGGDVGGASSFARYMKPYEKEGIELGLSESEAKQMCKQYGSNVTKVYKWMHQNDGQMEKYSFTPEVYGKLLYAVNDEYIVTPLDFFLRRTGSLLFNINWVYRWKEQVIQYMSDLFQWTKEEEESYTNELNREIQHATKG